MIDKKGMFSEGMIRRAIQWNKKKSGDANTTDFQTTRNPLEPWRSLKSTGNGDLEKAIRLIIIDMETEAVRHCELYEVKLWDWENPKIMRMVDERQIKSLGPVA